VFIGYSAPGLLDNRPSPIWPVFPGTEILAVAADNLLNGDALSKAGEGRTFLLILLATLAGAACALWPSRAGLSFALLPAALAGAAAIALAAFRRTIWIDLAAPELGGVLGFALASAYSYAVEGRQRRFLQSAFSHYLAPEVVREIVDNPEK